MDQTTFEKRKKSLMVRISRLQTLLEVSAGYPQWLQYDKEMEECLTELRQLMISDNIKDEQRLIKLN